MPLESDTLKQNKKKDRSEQQTGTFQAKKKKNFQFWVINTSAEDYGVNVREDKRPMGRFSTCGRHRSELRTLCTDTQDIPAMNVRLGRPHRRRHTFTVCTEHITPISSSIIIGGLFLF